MVKATADVRSLARSHAPEAIQTLAGIMRNCPNPFARVAASNSLLDRGYGKPQTDGEGREHINITIRKILEGSATVVEPSPSREIITIDHKPAEEEKDE
jgi:hypothetical protein